MTPSGRTSIVLAAAIVLPTLIFASLQIAAGYRDQSSAIEDATLERARKIVSDADARLSGVRAALGVASTIRSIDGHDWREAYRRIGEIMALDREWRAIRLIDVASETVVFDTRRPLGAPAPVDEMPAYDPQIPMTVGDVAPSFMGCPCVSVVAPVRRQGKVAYLLVLALDTRDFQAITSAAAPAGGVTGLVDAHGHFVTRTIGYPERVGTEASTYVRAAIRAGDSGLYKGVTLEGLVNFTGFVKSPWTGWSAHVAVSSDVLANQNRGRWTATAVAALVSLALSAAMAWFGLRSLAEQRRQNEQFERTARTEAIGNLAGGMAHDFNNMLTIVIASLDLMRRRLANGQTDVMRYVDNASEGAARAADLTRKMLAFSRRQLLEPQAIDVNALVREMRDLLERTLPASIRIDLDLAATRSAFADPRELENAIVNLAVNARDAMPDGGVLTIATRDVPAAPAGGRGDEAVAITMCDDGVGMSEAVAKQAFEPFFTTKEVGRGTGLGLSQVYGFARQSGGHVVLRSRPGEGTRVRLVLPKAAEAAVAFARRETLGALPTGSREEIVLVVEDEERVRKSTVETLRELGYAVLHAPNGVKALDVLESAPEVRLLFTDLVMPELGGRELAARATVLRPALKVLFATGYERDPAPAASWRVLAKPYSLAELARNVRETLDG